MRVRYSVRALQQLEAIYDHILTDDHRAARKVTRYIQSTIDHLANMPELGRKTTREHIYRLVTVGYPCLVYYRYQKGGDVLIMAIMHTSQDR